MSRVLLVPAAGLGSRLGAGVPKLLVPVGGVPMIDRLLRLYKEHVSAVVLIVHPSFEAEMRHHVAGWPLPVSLAVQERPTGMLDAILLGTQAIRAAAADDVWITWCDQVAVHPVTVDRLATALDRHPGAALALPTVAGLHPYIHFERDGAGSIVRVLHRREGDDMPAAGESDMGLFAMTTAVYCDELAGYALEPGIGRVTGERNFLPFIPWLAARRPVVTFSSVDPMEAVGVNTPADLARVETYLAGRTAPSSAGRA